MARVLKDDNDEPSVGSCIICGEWGPAYSHCYDCPEGSGAIYFPEEGINYRGYNNTSYDDENEEDEVYYAEDSNVDLRDRANAKTEEDNFKNIEDVETTKFLNEWHPKYKDPLLDKFRQIPIEDLFDEIHEHLETTETKREYIVRNYATMELFNYTSIPTIIQNFDNINFNIKVYNEYYIPQIKLNQRPTPIKLFSTEEIGLLIKWGIYLIQEYARLNMQQIPTKSDLNQVSP